MILLHLFKQIQIVTKNQQQSFKSAKSRKIWATDKNYPITQSLNLCNFQKKMFPQSGLRLTRSVSRIVQHVNTITSLQECQSRIQSRVSGEQEQVGEEYEQRTGEYDSISRWMEVYRSSNADRNIMLANNSNGNNPLDKYDITPTENVYFEIKLKRVMNLQISLRDFSSSMTRSKSSQKIKPRSSQDLYLQFSLQFISQDTQLSIGKVYFSQYHRLEQSQNIRQRYNLQEEIDMYFYYRKSFENVGIRVVFFSVLCEKEGKVSMVLDKNSLGTVFINLNDHSRQNYFLQHPLEAYFDYCQKSQSQDRQHNAKTDEYAQISIISSPYDGLTVLSSVLLPFHVYTSESRVMYAKNSIFPKDIQNVRFSHSPYTLNFQLTSIIIPHNTIVSAKTKCQNLLRFKYLDIQKIDDIQVKEYRMVVCCHNGEKIISASNCLLKKAQSEEFKNNNSNYKGSRHRISTGENYDTKSVRQLGKDSNLKLVNEGVTSLDLVFDAQGVMIVCQVFCRIEIKLQSKHSSKQLSQSIVLPLSYFAKPIISLQNDVKYIESLFNGQLLGPKGIQGFIEQQKRKYEQNQKSRTRPSNLVSYDKILSKANSMTQSTIEFYVFKDKKDGPNRYHTTIEDSKDMSLSLSVVQKGHGNDINRLIMQKARLQRERQKMQQKIHKMNIENNNKIPLLDPTELKAQIYQQKIKKMRDSKYELKTTLNYLKSKVDEFERQQFVKNEMIHDTLGKVFGQTAQKKGQLNLGQRLIGARGGMAAINKSVSDAINQQSQQITKAMIPENNGQIQFAFTIANLLKLIKYLRQPRVIEISLSEMIFYHDSNNIKGIELLYGFEQMRAVAYKSDMPDTKITIPLPQMSANLLTTVLFSPLTLYIVNSETHTLIGKCFFYLIELCNKIVLSDHNLSQDTIQIDSMVGFIFNLSQIEGKVNISISMRKMDQIDEKNQSQLIRNDLYEAIQNKISEKNTVFDQQRRKLMRIQNFKKKANLSSQSDNPTTVKLKSQALQKTNQQNQLQKVFSQLTGDKYTIFYYSLSYNIIKIPIQNQDNQTKSYQISIKDPDSQHLLPQFSQESPQFQELGCVHNSEFLINRQEMIGFNSQTQRFQLDPHKNAILMLEYSSRRGYFGPMLKNIEIKHLTLSSSARQQLLRTYNHKRNINVTLSSQQGVEKVINVNIEPKRDSNTISMTYYFEEQTEFAIPLPLCDLISKDNIYFSHESVELVFLQEQVFLCGFAPEVNKVALFEVFVFPKPELFGKLAQQLQAKSFNQNDFEDIQTIKKLIYSQKVINLSFEVWGCHRTRSFELRLFEETEVLWEVSRNHFHFNNNTQTRENSSYVHKISSNQPHIYLCSSNLGLLGFRSSKTPSKINPCKNIALNQNEQKTLVKSVVMSCSLKNQTVVVQAQNSDKRQEILCRYLISVRTIKPYFDQEFCFQLEIDQLKEVLDKQDQLKSQNTQNNNIIKTLRQSFLVDISSLIDSTKEKTPQKVQSFISNELKFHSSQNFLKICSIDLETDPSKIKQFTNKKLRQQKVKRQQTKIKPQENKKKPTKEAKNTKDKKQVSTNQQTIVNVTLQLNCKLFAEKLKQNNRESQSIQTKHMNLFERVLFNSIDMETAFLSSIVGLSCNQKILYYKVDICRKKESEQTQLTLMRDILEKSQVKLKTSDDKNPQQKFIPKAIDFKNLFKF